jgi:hypothetical protein
LISSTEDLGQVHRRHADTVTLQDLLAVTDGVEGGWAGAHGTDAHPAQAAHDTAHGQEAREVGAERGVERLHHVLPRERERDPGLAQIVAEGDLAAERVAAPRRIQALEIVGVRLDQDRQIQSGQADGLADALLAAEVRQDDQQPQQALPVLAEERGAALGVGVRLDATHLGLLEAEHDGLDPHLLEQGRHVRTRLRHELVGEEVAVAEDNAQ